jgi:outer membrane receptor protein involved in Fe transport
MDIPAREIPAKSVKDLGVNGNFVVRRIEFSFAICCEDLFLQLKFRIDSNICGMKLKITLLLLVFCGQLGIAYAQQEGIVVLGTVVAGVRQQPVEFATVIIANPKTRKPITGVTTALDGTFEIKVDVSEFYIEISFIGFDSRLIEDFEIVEGRVSLGTIDLTVNTTALNEVVVRAEKSTTEFQLDKRVFNVGKDLSSTGMSALEVLNNVPSVQVSIEGVISLRGSTGVQVLINGKPSVLATDHGALGTITAEMIEKIEVITNPSAKYDAEGTSGIINIVMKKEEKKGVNGSITLNAGYPNNHSIGLSLNRRTDKFNLFTQLGFGHRTFPGKQETLNKDLINNTVVGSNGDNEKNETFYNFILGVDYHINKYNIVSLTGNFAYELETEYSNSEFKYWDETETLSSSWDRNETTTATNPKYQYDLQYKKDFKSHKDHSLLFSAQGHFFGKDQSSEYKNTPTFGTPNQGAQNTRTDFVNATYTFKLDYTNPISEKFTIESGAQYVISEVSNDYAVQNLTDGEWIQIPELSNIFDYNQKVLGIYGTGAYEDDNWGLKLGLRLEDTDMKTELSDTGEKNGQNYFNLFPSMHTSYKFTELLSVQAGYSKRIFRPRMRDLNPFFNIRNNFNIRTGNPDLLPEFTDSFELTAIYELNKISFNIGVFHRYTTDVIERITRFENNISITRPENLGTNRTTGAEFNAKYSPADWLTFNADVNYNYFKREGDNESTSFDFDANQWTSRLNAKLKLPAQIDFEITGNYRSEVRNVQSILSDNYFMDLGLRKKLMKGRTILNLSVRDVFASRNMESETNQPGFYLYNYRERGRFITLGVSFGFGKGEAMEFSGQKRF